MDNNTRLLLSKVAVELEDILGGVFVEPMEVAKNNTVKVGLCIKKQDEDVSPNIYFEQRDLDMARLNPTAVAEKFAKIYRENAVPSGVELEKVKTMLAFGEDMQSALRVRLVGISGNRAMLEGKPYKVVLGDMAALVHVDLTPGANNHATAIVSDALLEHWGKSFDEVYERALENMKAHAKYKTMLETLCEMNGWDIEDMPGEMRAVDDGMIIVSSDENYLGAGVLPAVLDDLKANYKRFVILPSSIHEVIVLVIEEAEPIDKDILDDMVVSTNAEAVELEEKLSDHAYYWNGESFEI